MESHNQAEWASLIGAFIINFGAAEMASFLWITKFSINQSTRDSAIGQPLSKRLKLVCELVQRSNLAEDYKKRALELWAEVAKLSKTRNIIAHSPFVTRTKDGKFDSGFLDVKKMKGIGPYTLEPLRLEDIARDGSKLATILQDIVKPF